MCFFFVSAGSMSLWHFKMQVISVHKGDVNMSVFQSQDIFQLLLPQQSLPSQCFSSPSCIAEALQCQQESLLTSAETSFYLIYSQCVCWHWL